MTYKVELTDADLDVLDGRCSEAAQKAADASKARRETESRLAGFTDKQADLVNRVVARARESGELSYSRTSINHCAVCSRQAGYALHKRSGRYHRKGEPDHKKPLSFSAIDYGRGFISISGHVSLGCCAECQKVVEPAILAEIATIPVALPHWFPGALTIKRRGYGGEVTEPRIEKCSIRRCQKCGAVQHEREMRRTPTLMGDGTVPTGCKSCPSERTLLFGPDPFDNLPGFVIYDVLDRRVLRSTHPDITVSP